MNFKEIIVLQSSLVEEKTKLYNQLVDLKRKYPIYFACLGNNVVINNVSLSKSPIPNINFYVVDVNTNGSNLIINIPSNINYIKTLEYEILRKELVDQITRFNKLNESDKFNKSLYNEIVMQIKYLKRHYINLYKKETNILKELIINIYNLRNGKNL